MRSLPARSQSSDVWLYAGGLMLEAATSDAPIGETAAQPWRALRSDGLLCHAPLGRHRTDRPTEAHAGDRRV
jgi:hypothetical protein